MTVVLATEDYRRLTSANIEAFQRFCDRVSQQAVKSGLTEKKLERLGDDQTMRVVIDTNVMISRLLIARSIPAQAVDRALREMEILVSEPTAG